MSLGCRSLFLSFLCTFVLIQRRAKQTGGERNVPFRHPAGGFFMKRKEKEMEKGIGVEKNG
jgi:hypothetical protein